MLLSMIIHTVNALVEKHLLIATEFLHHQEPLAVDVTACQGGIAPLGTQKHQKYCYVNATLR